MQCRLCIKQKEIAKALPQTRLLRYAITTFDVSSHSFAVLSRTCTNAGAAKASLSSTRFLRPMTRGMLVKIAPGRVQLSCQWTRGGIPLKNERASWQPIPLLKNCWLQTKNCILTRSMHTNTKCTLYRFILESLAHTWRYMKTYTII